MMDRVQKTGWIFLTMLGCVILFNLYVLAAFLIAGWDFFLIPPFELTWIGLSKVVALVVGYD